METSLAVSRARRWSESTANSSSGLRFERGSRCSRGTTHWGHDCLGFGPNPKRRFDPVKVFLPLFGGLWTRRTKMLRRPASNAVFVSNGLMNLLTEATLLILGILCHVHFAVLLRKARRVIELQRLSRVARLALSFPLPRGHFSCKAFLRCRRGFRGKAKLCQVLDNGAGAIFYLHKA